MQEAIRIGVASAVAALVALVTFVAAGAMEPVDLLFPGAKGKAPHVMVDDFGIDAVPDRFSYDGQEIYVIARRFPDVKQASDDGIAEFRMRRILQPALAWPAPAGDATIALLVLTNVLGVGLAAGGLADLAQRHGRDPRAGYLAPLALAFPLIITTTEPLAFGLGLAGLALADRHRVVPAIVLFGLAGLGRETALVMAVAAGLTLASRGLWRQGALVGLVPLVPFAAWAVVLRSQVPADTYESTSLLGFLDLPELTTIDVVTCVLTVLVMVVGVWRWRGVPVLWLTCAGFLACCALYIGDQFQWHGLPRVSAAAIAIGLAGLMPTRRGVMAAGRAGRR